METTPHKKIFVLTLASLLSACGGSDSNDAPVFTQATQTISLEEDNSASGQVTATDSDQVTYSVSSTTNNGVFQLSADGTFTYTPNADFAGTDSVRVSASDGSLTANSTINFTISNVNDAPILQSSALTFTSAGTSQGLLSANDADGDVVTFTIVTPPQSGTLVLDENTGAFTYTNEELSSTAGEFTIAYTDGIISQAIEAIVTLTPSYVSNLDKTNFYFSSPKSHLKQTEVIKADIVDDILRNEINIELAAGYFKAGFNDIAQNALDEITTLEELADAYNKASKDFLALGDVDRSLELLSLAVLSLNQYIAEKGLENITSSDAAVYLGYVRSFSRMGEAREAAQLLATLNIIASGLQSDGQYTSTYGTLITAFDRNATDLEVIFVNDRTDENKQVAIDAIKEYAKLANNTGFFTQRRGEFEGQPTDRLRALYVTRAAEAFYNIGERELAKQYLNIGLSLYGIVGIDPNYEIEASPYTQANIGTYTFPVSTLAGLVEALYPELDTNPALAILTSSFDLEDAQVSITSKQIIEDIVNGVDVSVATQAAFDLFLPDEDYQSIYEALVESPFALNAGPVLTNLGLEDKAKAVYKVASDLLTSRPYVEDVRSMSGITGFRGCARLVQLVQQANGDALAQAKACETMVNTLLTSEADIKSTSNALVARDNLLTAFNFVGAVDDIKATIAGIAIEQALLTDLDDKAKAKLQTANYLLEYDAPIEAQTMFNAGLVDLRSFVTEQEAIGEVEGDEALEYAISKLEQFVYRNDQARTGFSEQQAFLKGLRFRAGTNNYADLISTSLTVLRDEASFYSQKLLASNNVAILENMNKIIEINYNAGNIDLVNTFIDNELNLASDRIELQADLALYYAQRDDFPATPVALIDSDNDGLPNFFIVNAAQADIDASGLVADQDADNDGIADENDVEPLVDQSNNLP